MVFTSINPPSGYYVYAYIRSKDSDTAKAGTPYYIGKGSKNRAWHKTTGEIGKPRNSSLIVILEHNLTEIGALAIERRMISWYGRLDTNTGVLRNKTDGGDGGNGIKLTQLQLQKLSDAKTGRKIKPRSEEHCKKLSLSKKGEKNPNYGKVYTEEEKQILSNALKGKPNPKSGEARLGVKLGPYKNKGQKRGPYKKKILTERTP